MQLFFKLCLFLPVFGMLVGVNFSIDPAHLFRTEGYMDGIAQLLADGKNVANLTDYDQGLLQRYYVERLAQRKEIVVLGSSRSTQIRARLFAPKSFFNSSIYRSTLQDMQAVYQLYYQKGLIPSTVILSLDYTMLDENWPEMYPSLQKAYGASASRLGRTDPSGIGESIRLESDRYAQLVSPGYFQEALKAWLIRRRPDSYYGTDETEGEEDTKLSDGSVVWRRAMQVRSISEVRQLVVYNMDAYPKKYNSFNPDKAKEFAAFMNLMRQDGVAVVLFLPPYHPFAYRYWTTEGHLWSLVRVEEFIRKLAQQEQIPLLGSFDPSVCGCNEGEFFDESHAKESCVNRIFASSNVVTQR